jgi:hypothetical protein
VIALPTDAEQRQRLPKISRSRTEPTSRVEQGYLQDPSAYAVARKIGVTQPTVTRCLQRAAELGVIEALDDRPRAGRDPELPRRVGGLLRLDLLQYGRQPLVVDDRTGLHCLDLVDYLETERCSHHPVVMQGQVACDRALLPPSQDLVQIIGLCQRSMQVFDVRWITAEACVVGGDEPRQPCLK